MKYNPEIHHNRSIRLKGYDYSSEGAYFITICTKNKECLFGDIINGKMVLNDVGDIIKNEWENTSIIRKNVIPDEYIIMPNHLHGIIIINYPEEEVRMQYAPTNDEIKTEFKSPSKTIGSIIRGFKSTTTKNVWNYIINNEKNNLRRCVLHTHFLVPKESIWQRNYYEHIIRSEKALNNIIKYIIENPLKWELDRENKNGIYDKYKFKNIQEINNFDIAHNNRRCVLHTHSQEMETSK